MGTFIELVILPALLPWLITLVTGWIEDWLDRRDDLTPQQGLGTFRERMASGKGCMVLGIPPQARVTSGYSQD